MSLNYTSRINVVGTSGSGKSTLAKALAAKLDCPYVEMDSLYWKKNWQDSTDEEFFAKVESALAADAWVLDGNYTRTTPIKWKNVQMVVWVDMPFFTTLYRAIKRAVTRLISREELWHGNRESLSKLFSRDSIICWTIKTHKKNRTKYEEMMRDKQYAHIQFVRLQTPKSVAHFVELFYGLLNIAHLSPDVF